MKRLLYVLCGLLLAAALTPVPASARAEATGEVFTMDTYAYIYCTGARAGEAVDSCIEELQRLDSLLSTGNPESEISVINTNGEGPVSDDTARIIGTALSVWESTGGAFDISVYPLMQLWGFTTGLYSVPEDSRIEAALSFADSAKVVLDTGLSYVTIGEGQGIDLGGIAKGFASDRMMEIFESFGVGGGYITIGGNVQCFGTKANGSMWNIGIQDPRDQSSIIGAVRVTDSALITSGAYQRCFTDEATGAVYHHIIDPSTGYPADSGLISVTVISPSGILADALSTSCFIMGLDRSVEYWRSSTEDFELVLMTADDAIYITEGLKGSFSSTLPYTVIEKQR